MTVSFLNQDSHYLDPSVAHLLIRMTGLGPRIQPGSIWMAGGLESKHSQHQSDILEVLPRQALGRTALPQEVPGSISQGALAYLLRIRIISAIMVFPQRGPGVGKLMGGINMLGFFFLRKNIHCHSYKNLFEVKSGVRTTGERSPEDSTVMDLRAERGRQSASPAPFSILSLHFPSPVLLVLILLIFLLLLSLLLLSPFLFFSASTSSSSFYCFSFLFFSPSLYAGFAKFKV